MFPYVTFTQAAKVAGVSRQRFIRAFLKSKLRAHPIEGSDMQVIHQRDIERVKSIALSQRRGRPKKRGG